MIKSFTALLREPNLLTRHKNIFYRGAKKKKEEVSEAQSNDIVNIFKDRSDNPLKPLDQYPAWLTELSITNRNGNELIRSALFGTALDGFTSMEKRGFLNQLKKLRLKESNIGSAYKRLNSDNAEDVDLADDEEELSSPISGLDIEYIDRILSARYQANEEAAAQAEDEDEEGGKKAKPREADQDAGGAAEGDKKAAGAGAGAGKGAGKSEGGAGAADKKKK